MLEIKDLTKDYGSKLAVDHISFQIRPGEILGFLGPNGAGKSSTMNMITGYLSATEGTVCVDGYDILEDPVAAKKRIGYLPEHPPLYPDMTVKRYLSFVYDLKKVTQPKKAHILEICGLLKLEDVMNRMIGHLSKGYRQRVGMAQALIGYPDYLILDEPTAGLDPKQIIEFRNLIKNLGKRHTVLLSSHILPEIQAVCNRVIVINGGKLVADDTPENLVSNRGSRMQTVIEGPAEEVRRALEALEGIRKVRLLARQTEDICEYLLEGDSSVAVRRLLFRQMANHNWPILGLEVQKSTLEDVFLRLTQEEEGGDHQ